MKHAVIAYAWEAHELKRVCSEGCPACEGVAHGDGVRVHPVPEVQGPDGCSHRREGQHEVR